jgi:hypothetical protein
MEAGFLYLAIVNQFMNQEHDVHDAFLKLLKDNDWGEVRRIPLPVSLRDDLALKDLKNLYTGNGEIMTTNISEWTEEKISRKLHRLMFCEDSTISDHFRMINVFARRAMDHARETRKHRTFLVSMFEKA